MRCAYCHETLNPSLARACAGCHTQVHPECGEDLRACPTLGCEVAWAAGDSRRDAPPGALRGWARGRWILMGAALPALAFFVDLFWRMDPLVWGAFGDPLGPCDEVTVGVRAPLIWSLVTVAITGLLAYLLRGDAARGRWGLGVGVGLALAHAVVFLPMVPLSVIGVVYLGVGLLGLSPYAALWVYVAALRRAQRQAAADPKRAGPCQGPWWIALATVGLLAGVHVVAPIRLNLAAPAAVHFERIGEAQLRSGVRALRAAGADRGDHWNATELPPSLADFAAEARVSVTEAWVEFHWDDDPAFPYGYSLFVRREGWTLLPSHGVCYRYVELAPGIWSGWFRKSSPPGSGPAYVELANGAPSAR